MELEPLSFLLIQQEAVDGGEQLIRRHRGNEALSVQPSLVQQHHAEVGSGDSEYLSAEKHNAALKETSHTLIFNWPKQCSALLYNNNVRDGC